MAKDNYNARAYNFLVKSGYIDPQEVNFNSFNSQMSNPDFSRSIYSNFQDAKQKGKIGTLKPFEEFVAEFQVATPATMPPVTQAQPPAQAGGASFPTPTEINQPVGNQPLPNVVAPQAPQTTPTGLPVMQDGTQMPTGGGQIPGMPQPEMPVAPQGLFAPQPQPSLANAPYQAVETDVKDSPLGMPQTQQAQPTATPQTSLQGQQINPEVQQETALSKAIRRGYNQGKLAELITITGTPTYEQVKEIAQVNQENAMIPISDAMAEYEQDPSLWNGLRLAPEVALQSIVSMINAGKISIPALTAAGAGVGAVGGAGVGAIPGAAYGFGAGMSASGAAVEVSSSIIQSLQDQGVDTTNPDELYKAFNDPKIIARAKDFATKRMIPILVFDAAAMGIAGNILKIPTKTMLGTLTKASGELGVQMAGGGGGEAVAQLASGQPLNWAEIQIEALGEIGSAPIDIAVGSMRMGSSNPEDISRVAVNPEITQEQFNQTMDFNAGAGQITVEQADKAKADFAKAQEINATIPEDIKEQGSRIAAIGIIEERNKLTAQLEGIDEAFKPQIQEKIKALNQQLQDLGTIGLTPEAQTFFDSNEASLTNPIATMPAEVETVFGKISDGIMISPEGLSEAYNWVNESFKAVIGNQALSPAEKGATLNILNGMLSDIDKANTEGQKSVEEVETASVQDRVPAVREGVAVLPEGQNPSETTAPVPTPSITKAREVKQKTNVLPSSGEVIVTPEAKPVSEPVAEVVSEPVEAVSEPVATATEVATETQTTPQTETVETVATTDETVGQKGGEVKGETEILDEVGVNKEWYDKFTKEYPNNLLAIEEDDGKVILIKNGKAKEISERFYNELKSAIQEGYKGIAKVTRKQLNKEQSGLSKTTDQTTATETPATPLTPTAETVATATETTGQEAGQVEAITEETTLTPDVSEPQATQETGKPQATTEGEVKPTPEAKPKTPIQDARNARRQAQAKAKAPTQDQRVKAREAYFKPGAIVESYGGGKDKVIEYNQDPNDPTKWSVTVQGVDAQGNPVGEQRTHKTEPTDKEYKRAGVEVKAEKTSKQMFEDAMNGLKTEVEEDTKAMKSEDDKGIILRSGIDLESALAIPRAAMKVLGFGDAFISRYTTRIADATARAMKRGMRNSNAALANAVNISQGIIRNLGRQDPETDISRRAMGEVRASAGRAMDFYNAAVESVNADPQALMRVQQVLDPDLYESKVSKNKISKVEYADLNTEEQRLYDLLRANLDMIHEWHHENGFISDKTYEKFKGNYSPRFWEENYESDMDAETQAMSQQMGKALNKDYIKMRKDLDEMGRDADDAVQDPVFGVAMRMAQMLRNQAIMDYAKQLDGTTSVWDGAGDPPPGYILLDGKRYGSLNGKYVSRDVADDFKGYFMTNFFMNELYKFNRLYDGTKLRQFQKKIKTIYDPIVFAGNIGSNFYFAFQVGVDPFSYASKLNEANKSIDARDADYKYLLEEGVLGTDLFTSDIQARSESVRSSQVAQPVVNQSGVGKALSNAMESVEKWYGKVDDIGKLAAFKSLVEQGVSREDAARRVFEGFQNYGQVGRYYDFAAKTPVFGNPYIKFKGDLLRTKLNNIKKRPLTFVATYALLNAVAMIASKASGEDEELRRAREAMPYKPKVPMPKYLEKYGIRDIPLTLQIGETEVNMARLFSPDYVYDTGDEGFLGNVEEITSYLPFQLQAKEEGEAGIPVYPRMNDILIAPIVQLWNDRDFRNKPIMEKTGTKYREGREGSMDKLFAASNFLGNAYIPFYGKGHSLYSAALGTEDMYDRKRSIGQSLLNMAVKVKQMDRPEVVRAYTRDIDYLLGRADNIEKEITSQLNKSERDLEQAISDGDEVKQEKIVSQTIGKIADLEDRKAKTYEKAINKYGTYQSIAK
jgi:hypothetical protein